MLAPTRLRTLVTPGLAAWALVAGTAAQAAVVPGQIVLRTGDAPTGGPLVTEVGDPFVNDGGQVGLLGTLDDGDHFVFVAGSVVWLGSDAMGPLLFVTELEMDSTAAAGFVYAPVIDGLDGLWTHNGLLAQAGDPAEGFPMGATYAFHGRPSMTADGSIHWIAGIDLDGSGDAEIQAFYRSPDAMPGGFELLLAGGDMVDALVIDDAFAGTDGGIDGDYAVSEDGAHRIHVLNMEGDPATDSFVWVDGALVMREGDPTGDGDGWGNFDLVSINAAGDYLVTGNTDGPPGTDEFIAVNGTLAIREGDVVGGVTLQSSASLRFASLDDQGRAAHAWGYQMAGSFRETVFFSCNAAELASTSVPILTSFSDSIDVDGDAVGDYTVEDVLATTDVAARGLGGTTFVYAEVELNDGMGITQGIVEIPVICCGNGMVDPGEECDDANAEDTDECLATCVAASCGDGIVQDGVEECDDGNDADTDACTTACVAASCGDGIVQDGVEECDDGNDDDTDECRSDCTIPVAESTGADTLDTGADETAGTGAGETGVDPDAGTLDAGTLDAGGTDSETDTDTAGAGDGDGGGCGCRTEGRPAGGVLAGLLGLGLVGLRRRRSRR